MPRPASPRQPRWATGRVSRLLMAVACAMAMGVVGLVSACGGNDADPVKSLSAAASEIADDLTRQTSMSVVPASPSPTS